MNTENKGAVEIREAELNQVKGGSARLQNNLKQLGLAAHNYESAAAGEPVPAIKAAD